MRMCDGSLSADLPHDRLKELFNVQVFIVSQVNPHVVKFLSNPAVDALGRRSGPPGFVQRLVVRCSVKRGVCLWVNVLNDSLVSYSCVSGNFVTCSFFPALSPNSCVKNGPGT